MNEQVYCEINEQKIQHEKVAQNTTQRGNATNKQEKTGRLNFLQIIATSSLIIIIAFTFDSIYAQSSICCTVH